MARDRTMTTGPVPRRQILRRERRQRNIHFLCSADREQDWQPFTGDPYQVLCYKLRPYIHIHTYIHGYPWSSGDRKKEQKNWSLESKPRPNSYQVIPSEDTRNLFASRRCLWVRTTASFVWSAASITSESELQNTSCREDCLMCFGPSTKINQK